MFRALESPTAEREKPRLTIDIPSEQSKKIENIVGYVVNVHDVLNFDIDLWLTPEQRRKYSGIIVNSYQYIDETEGVAHTSLTYRCRLRGIGSSSRKSFRETPRAFSFQFQKVFQEVKYNINRQNGWVLVNIFDVDVYRRLLVEIYDPVTRKNIKDVLMQPAYADFFYVYPLGGGESERNRRSRASGE